MSAQIESFLNCIDTATGTQPFTIGSISTASTVGNWTWYPAYWCSHTDNRMQIAFKIVKHLMDKKLVKLTTISQFINLIDELMIVL